MVRRKKSPPRTWAPRLDQRRSKLLRCRLPDHVHAALTRAAAGNNWTISAESVDRLEESFAVPATQTQAYFSALAYAIDSLTLPKGPQGERDHPRTRAAWLNNPYLFREARRATERAFELVQKLVVPTGELPTGEDPALIGGPIATPNGQIAFDMWWNEIRRHNPNIPVDNSNPRHAKHQRLLSKLREGARSLADAIALEGATGRQVQRKKGPSFSVHDFNRLRRLALLRIKPGLSKERHKLFQALLAKAPAELREQWKLGDLSNPGPFPEITPPVHGEPWDEDNRPLDIDSDTPRPAMRGKIDVDDEGNYVPGSYVPDSKKDRP
jgi:hypothetical protein